MSISLKSKDLKLILKALTFIKPYKFKFVCAIVCVIAGIGLDLVQPLLWGILLTKLFDKSYDVLIKVILGLVILYLLQVFFNFFKSYLFNYLNENIIYDLRIKIYKRILNLSVSVFDTKNVGAFMSHLNEDVTQISNIVTNELLNTVVSVFKVIAIGVIIFAINPILAVITIVSFPVTYSIFNFSGKMLREKNKRARYLYDKYFNLLQESISAIKEIKSLGIKNDNLKRFMDISLKLKNSNIKMDVVNSISNNICLIVNFISEILIYSVGGYLVLTNKIYMEYFISFTSYSQQFSNSLTNVTQINSKIQKVLVSLERIFNLFSDFEYVSETFGNLDINALNGSVDFENVYFKYNDKKEILNGVSFNIKANKKYAIVGKSGVGKSSIFSLFLNFYKVSSGQIKIDGININDFNEQSLRRHIAVVNQEPFIFNLSIRENLLLVNPNASFRDIENACRIANIHDYISELPERYDFVVSGNGKNLSGGQKQRIAIARSILSNAKILLFDEATASLDNDCRYKFKKSINDLVENHTIIIITHKISDIIDSEKIFVIDNGQVISQGKHEFLIQNNELYKNLYQKENCN